MTEIIAHRGNSAHAPENTVAAFESAIAAGADRIELDVQLGADGVPFVFHDIDLERLTGLREVACSLPATQLTRLHVLPGRFGEREDSRIPTLDAVVERFADRIPLYVEIKADGAGPGPDARARLTRACLDRLRDGSGHVIASFDLEVVRTGLDAGFPTVLVASDPRRWYDLTSLEIAGLRAYSVLHERIDARLVATCEERGIALWTWTIDEPRHFERLRRIGADRAWCTNDVPELRAWLRR